jgi:raffinose/stachyose/melibiose transport system permease protein
MNLTKARTLTFGIALNGIMAFASALALFPLFWMVNSSFKTEASFLKDVFGMPTSLRLENYALAIKVGRLAEYTINSLYITVISVFLVVCFSFIAGYFINRFRFPGRRLIYALFLVGMMIPVHGFLVPLYIQFSWLGMTNKWYTLILPDTAFALPLAVMLVENFLNGIPFEIEESAIMDGAGLATRLVYVVMPICKPILATILIINSLWIWNEFPFALTMISSRPLRTLPLGLSNFRGEHAVQFVQQLAAITLVSIPIFVVYSIFSRKIMDGMTAGAIKG